MHINWDDLPLDQEDLLCQVGQLGLGVPEIKDIFKDNFAIRKASNISNSMLKHLKVQ